MLPILLILFVLLLFFTILMMMFWFNEYKVTWLWMLVYPLCVELVWLKLRWFNWRFLYGLWFWVCFVYICGIFVIGNYVDIITFCITIMFDYYLFVAINAIMLITSWQHANRQYLSKTIIHAHIILHIRINGHKVSHFKFLRFRQ